MGNLFPLLHAAPGKAREKYLPSGMQGRQSASADHLAVELPYLQAGSVSGFGPVHLLSDDTLGYAFSMTVPVVDTTPDAEQCVSDTILSMLHALAPGTHWQWFLHSSSVVEDSLDKYQLQPGNDAAGTLFCDALVDRWRRAQSRGFFPDEQEHDFHPRAQKITIALKSPPLGLAATNPFGLLTKSVPEVLARIRRQAPRPREPCR